MAKEITHVLVVEPSSGSMFFPFPIDMLRYDRLTPKSEEDSAKIISTVDGRLERRTKPRENITISLTRQAPKNWTPTTGRWASFNWKVTSHTKGGF